MFSKNKRASFKLFSTLGAIAVGIFAYFILTGKSMVHSTTFFNDGNGNTVKIKDKEGHYLRSNGIANAFVFSDNLHITWFKDSDSTMMESYYPKGCTGGDCWVHQKAMLSGVEFGVNTINITDSLACSFFKTNKDNARYTGAIYSQCIDQQGSVLGERTKFSGKNLTNNNYPELNKISGVMSIVKSNLDQNKFYASLANEDSDGNRLYIYECNMQSTTNPNFNEDCVITNTMSGTVSGIKDPSIVAVPKSETEEVYYTFIRWEPDNNNIWYIPSSEPGVAILMINDSQNTRATANRPASAYYDGKVYVAWKNDNNPEVRFAVIDANDENLFDGNHGRGKWRYCQFHDEGGEFDPPIAKTNHGPSFFEYDGEFFLLWSNDNENNLAYHSINHVLDNWDDFCYKN